MADYFLKVRISFLGVCAMKIKAIGLLKSQIFQSDFDIYFRSNSTNLSILQNRIQKRNQTLLDF